MKIGDRDFYCVDNQGNRLHIGDVIEVDFKRFSAYPRNGEKAVIVSIAASDICGIAFTDGLQLSIFTGNLKKVGE